MSDISAVSLNPAFLASLARVDFSSPFCFGFSEKIGFDFWSTIDTLIDSSPSTLRTHTYEPSGNSDGINSPADLLLEAFRDNISEFRATKARRLWLFTKGGFALLPTATKATR